MAAEGAAVIAAHGSAGNPAGETQHCKAAQESRV
jgi:hypothetical protein